MKRYSLRSAIIKTLVPISVLITSCLENTPLTEPVEMTDDFLYVTTFLETQRNSISGQMPAMVNVQELYNNINNYLIIDIRDESDYSVAHIPSSVNISPENIYNYFKDIKNTDYQKIVIVSLTGQKAAYVSTLLRLLGNNNVYSLNYGLGYWNSQFANIWIESKASSQNVSFYRNNFPPVKLYSVSNIPSDFFDDDDMSLDEKIDFRVNNLLKNSISNFQASLDEFESNYDKKRRRYNNCSIIYYGDPTIFNFVYSYTVIIRDQGFYVNTFGLNQNFTLRPEGTLPYNIDNIGLEQDLLSIPTNRIIYLYSINGQESAALAAYLNILGYNVKSIRFGAHAMYSKYFYNKAINGNRFWTDEIKMKEYIDTAFTPTPILLFSFDETLIMDYPVVSGG